MSAPVLDDRSYQDLLAELRAAAARTAPDWDSSGTDAGAALVSIFAHYLEILLARLNRVPEKQLLAFLDLMGVGLLPPAAARTPLVFSLAPDAGDAGAVEAGTQVATAQTATDPAVVFETDHRLIVVAARLVEALTIDPSRDRYADRSAAVRGEDPVSYDPFRGDRPLDHSFLLGVPDERAYLLQAPGRIVVDLALWNPDAPPADPEEARRAAAEILQGSTWSVRRGGGWVDLAPPYVHGLEVGIRVWFDGVNGSDEAYAPAGAPARRWLRATRTPVQEPFAPYALALRAASAVPPYGIWAAVEGDAGENAVAVEAGSSFEPVRAAGESLWLSVREGLDPELPFAVARIAVEKPAASAAMERLEWSYTTADGGWSPFEAVTSPLDLATTDDSVFDLTGGLQLGGDVVFRVPDDLGSAPPGGGFPDGPYLRATWPATGAAVPRVQSIHFLRGIAPDAAAVDASPLDITKAFAPFGAQPALDTAFYVASREAFSRAGASAHLFFRLASPGAAAPGLSVDDYRGAAGDAKAAPPVGKVVVEWETFTARGWTSVGRTTIRFTAGTSGYERQTEAEIVAAGPYFDLTRAFYQDGNVRLRLPDDVAETEVAGISSFWVRARLAVGGFGRPPEFVPDSGKTGVRLKLDTGNLQPPVVSTLRVAYDDRAAEAPTIVSRNEGVTADLTAGNAAVLAESSPAGLAEPLLAPPEEDEQTLYLGLDRKPANTTLSLFFAVPPRQIVERLPVAWVGTDEVMAVWPLSTDIRDTFSAPAELRAEAAAAAPQLLAWEYWNGLAWTALVVEDGTNDLTESGIVQFIAPSDFASLAKFDAGGLWWVRVRALVDPRTRLDGVYLNAVEAVQTHTVRDEILGSSTGDTEQSFRLSQTPVSPGQTILVREPEWPPAAEQKILADEEGADAIPTAGAGDIWIRWHEAPTLYGSGPRSRHYTVDRLSGVVRFGDGVRGLVPPPGTDNVLAREYRAGGGAAGNRPAGSITKLKTSIPYVQAVTNPLPADGGSEPETLEQAQVRGPQSLRNAGRAVTADDFEWIAQAAAGTRVARARVLTGVDRDLASRPGWMTVVVVPRSGERKPLPSAQLVREVEDVLSLSAAPALVEQTPSRINVIGPGYLPVSLVVEVVPASLDQADVVRLAALAALDRFLHPLTGGPAGDGWEFGRDVYLSELYATLEGVAGVEHVHSVAFAPTLATTPLRLADASPSALDAGTAVRYAPGGGLSLDGWLEGGTPLVVGRLVEPVPAGGRDAMTTVFQEGERVTLTPWVDGGLDATDAVELDVRGLTATTAIVEPFLAATDFPVGSLVATVAGTGATLLAAVSAGEIVDRLMLQGWDAAAALGSRLRVPPSHLVYSGEHLITVGAD